MPRKESVHNIGEKKFTCELYSYKAYKEESSMSHVKNVHDMQQKYEWCNALYKSEVIFDLRGSLEAVVASEAIMRDHMSNMRIDMWVIVSKYKMCIFSLEWLKN